MWHRDRGKFLVVMVILALAGPVPGAAEDWPQWRGPERDGVWSESGILSSFPEGGLEVVWRAPVASGYAGPAVSDGRVFVPDWLKTEGTATMGGTERVHAFDEKTGEKLWTQEWPVGYGSIMASYAIGPRVTPTVDRGLIFIMGAVGDLLAVEAETGEVAWKHQFVEEYDASMPIWGTSSAPLVDGDLVIVVAGAEPDGKVIAYDRLSGKEVWRAISSDWEMGYDQPVIIESGGVRQLIIWEPTGVFSLNPRTGEQYWSQEWEAPSGLTVATPVFNEDRLFLSQFYRGSMLLQLDSSKPAAKQVWVGTSKSEMPDRTEGLHALITTPVLEGDTIYGVGSYGEFRGLDAATGERLWVDEGLTRQGRWGTAFMVKNGDRWFVNNDVGDLIIMKLTREGPHEISRTQLIEPTSHSGYGPRRAFDATINWVHPAFANRHVVTRNDKEVVRISLAE